MISSLSLLFLALGKTALYCGWLPGMGLVTLAEFPYVYRWAKYLGMAVCGGNRKGQFCKVIVRGQRNSCVIEFPDGYQAVTSRNALRRVK